MALIEFIEYWYKKGKEEDDAVFRFFCYYVAFNHLFDSCNSTRRCSYASSRIKEDCSNCGEKNKIDVLVKKYRKGLNSMFNPFNEVILNKESELIEETVKNDRNGRSEIVNKEVKYGVKEPWNFQNLFRNIHQVRCNLFHGAKDMSIVRSRDGRLVEESADVLEHFLEVMMEVLQH